MRHLYLAPDFYSRGEVLAVGPRPIGSWILMATWAAQQGGAIPFTARRLFGATRSVINELLEVEMLMEHKTFWLLGQGRDSRYLWRIGEPSLGRRPIPASVRIRVFERDEYRCQFCSAISDLTLDHIIPWSHGGEDSVENLRVLCRSCNSARGNRVEIASATPGGASLSVSSSNPTIQ